MRYVTLFLWSLFCFIFNSSIAPVLHILGGQLDLVLASIAVMTMMEKTLTPTFYMAGVGLLLDICFSWAIGFYTLQYLAVGIIVYSIVRARQASLLSAGILGGLMAIVKDLIGLFLSLIMDNAKPFFATLLTKTLPNVGLSFVLCMLLFLLAKKIYSYRFIWPIRADSTDL